MIKDNHQLQGFNTPKFPKLKGHIKLTLHNVHNGKNEVYEGDNIVTNAVQDIFANNYLGAIDTTSLLPLYTKWYGGVLCYEEAHPNLNADDYFPQSDSDNHLTAHAGQTAIDPNHDDDDTRGNPIPSSYVETDNSVKLVWEWGTTYGNGVISALSLTHSDTGNAGLGGTGYAFQQFSPFAVINSSILTSVNTNILSSSANCLFAEYDETHGIGFHIGAEDEYYTLHTMFSTDTLTIYVRKLPYKKVGLFETMTSSTDKQRQFTVELPFTVYCMPAWYFDEENKYLWIFTNIVGLTSQSPKIRADQYSKTNVKYAVIDCENETVVTSGTIVSDQQDLAPLSMETTSTSAGSYNADWKRLEQVVKEGNYVYFPTATSPNWYNYDWDKADINQTGFKKININSQADQSRITFNSTLTRYSAPKKQGGIIIEDGRVVNGSVGYNCQTQLTTTAGTTWTMQEVGKASTLVFPISSRSTTDNRYIFASKMVNTTKYNLPSSIQKTASQAMSVEYTLTEVEPSE